MLRTISALFLVWLIVPSTVHGATLAFEGSLSIHGPAASGYPILTVPGSGVASIQDDGSFHLLSLAIGSTFGPVSTSLPVSSVSEVQSVRFTSIANLTGTFAGLSGSPPGGGAMAVTGLARVCQLFVSCAFALDIPFTVTGTPARGFGVGGTQTFPGSIGVTLQHAAWTIGQPVLTIHQPTTTVTTPALPGGFAHGPASSASSTAQASGTLQLVTVTKAFSSLTSSFPQFPVTGVLNLHFVPEPGTLVLLATAAVAVGSAGRRRRRRRD